MRIITSTSAAARLDAARRFILDAPPAAETLIVSASRGAADDLARELARARGATFGLYRFSLTQLAARLAAPPLAQERLAPTTPLGVQAVAARALFDAQRDRELKYFTPVAATPGFPKALARTLEELALAGIPAGSVARLSDGGADLSALFERFDEQFQTVSAVDRAAFLRIAAGAAGNPRGPYAACRLLLLDVAITNAAERGFVEALLARAPAAMATVPAGDVTSIAALEGSGAIDDLDGQESADAGGLDRVRRQLFAVSAPPAEPLEAVELFSAPGEGREAVEIARRILREARRGVRFDRMAIALRVPQPYVGLLEHALERVGVPAYFERGIGRPHPAGRAFLSLIACAQDNLSARRFAEYLSLAQVPDSSDAAQVDVYPASSDEVFGSLADRVGPEALPEEAEAPEADTPARRAARAPWKWERLLAESRVVATEERWARRLNGLVQECELQRRELARTEPGAPRIDHLARKADDVRQLAAFALPIIRGIAEWPEQAPWAEWL
ncbi:MAG: hypothetical protein HY723_01020, partial [Chloroflexi bacterium]|nr:hypothetical protein [Chloroflexota bacterium]